MAKSIDTDSPTPVRAQLRTILTEEIQEGIYKSNQRIPSERDLAEAYGVSRASVREAIAELISEGTLFRAGGRGTFVAEAPPPRATGSTQQRQLSFWISEEIFHFVQAGYTKILKGAEDECRARGYSLSFHPVNEQSEAMELLFADDGEQLSVGGHIVTGGLKRSTIERLESMNRPLVVVDPLYQQQVHGVDFVRMDYPAGTRMAVEHVVSLGHREIGFIGFARSVKYEAFWQALEELGVPYNPRFVDFLGINEITPSIHAGFQSMSRLLAGEKRPTAVVVGNDHMALGAIEAVSIAGLSVPDDVSLIGYDDIGSGPIPLTTVRSGLVETGRLAVRMLLERIDKPNLEAREALVPVELVVRRSTAPAPSLEAERVRG